MRNAKLDAIGYFLCGDNLLEDYGKLKDAADSMDELFPEDIDVWEPFEYETASGLVELIEHLESLFTEYQQDNMDDKFLIYLKGYLAGLRKYKPDQTIDKDDVFDEFLKEFLK